MAETQGTQVEESIVSKLTVATLGCNPSLVKNMKADDPALENGELPLARLYGQLSGVRFQDDKVKGQVYTYFVGTFEGVNMQTGEVQRSGKMFLPKGISEIVEDAVRKASDADGKLTASLDFAFELRSIKASNPIGYSYKVLSLKSPAQVDELKALRDLVMKAGAVSQKRLTATQRGSGPTTIDANAPQSGHTVGKKSA